jgi:hypothetical protein
MTNGLLTLLLVVLREILHRTSHEQFAERSGHANGQAMSDIDHSS